MDLQEQEMLHRSAENPEGSEALSNKTGRFLNTYLLDAASWFPILEIRLLRNMNQFYTPAVTDPYWWPLLANTFI